MELLEVLGAVVPELGVEVGVVDEVVAVGKMKFEVGVGTAAAVARATVVVVDVVVGAAKETAGTEDRIAAHTAVNSKTFRVFVCPNMKERL